MMLQLADRLLKASRGVIEDILVQVDKFYYLVGFVVLDMRQPVFNIYQAFIILGWPFLATSNALINFQSGVLKLTFRNMTLEMNMFNAHKTPIGCDDLKLLSAFGFDSAFESESPEKPEVFDEKVPLIRELLESEGQSIEIDVIPIRDAQWRLNPIMTEVVKKEVLKMLDTDIIYPITEMPCALWFDDIVNYLVTDRMPEHGVTQDKRLRKLQVCELQESKREVYDKARLVKKRMKLVHDNKIKDKHLFSSQQVLLYDSRLHMFPRNLKSRWGDPHIVKHVHPHGAVDIVDLKNSNNFTVNGQRFKPFMTPFNPNEEVLLLQDPKGVF
ncbi:uncharacterized protein LOC131153853 [Malania oleifera]|uniref:uncharacterized protein LOC131153853 n=1 Tax=Malania oleifera TaxID=397392 RepID=UPI0025ADD88D|nr:uncharacterized protein LOC131153853 [Malania oleifera]